MKLHTSLQHMSETHPFLHEFEAAARELNFEPTTMGRLVNQGGHFHRRLLKNRRVWPETIEKVRVEIARLRAERASDGGQQT